MWREVKGPGKPYWRIPEGLTGDVGMGIGPEGWGDGMGSVEEVVTVGEGREMGVIRGDCCLEFEE